MMDCMLVSIKSDCPQLRTLPQSPTAPAPSRREPWDKETDERRIGALGQGDRRETEWSLGTRRPTRDGVKSWDKETDERRIGALGQGDRRETEWSLGTRRPTRDGAEPWDKETDERRSGALGQGDRRVLSPFSEHAKWREGLSLERRPMWNKYDLVKLCIY